MPCFAGLVAGAALATAAQPLADWYLRLEDVTSGLRRPCVADLKARAVSQASLVTLRLTLLAPDRLHHKRRGALRRSARGKVRCEGPRDFVGPPRLPSFRLASLGAERRRGLGALAAV